MNKSHIKGSKKGLKCRKKGLQNPPIPAARPDFKGIVESGFLRLQHIGIITPDEIQGLLAAHPDRAGEVPFKIGWKRKRRRER
jgi:hypothetical protein